MTDSEVKSMIVRAWQNAWKKRGSADSGNEQRLHKARSTEWVNALAEELQRLYQNGGTRVFWKGRPDVDFKLNELLFDVAVCQLGEITSVRRHETLHFVNRCLWLVESEFSNNSRDVLVDLSKLVMGSSKMKLFVAGDKLSERQSKERVLDVCKEAAIHCGKHFYFCFIPHPETWGRVPDEYMPSVWTLHANEWREILA